MLQENEKSERKQYITILIIINKKIQNFLCKKKYNYILNLRISHSYYFFYLSQEN